MGIKLYNTLARKKEEFKPIRDGRIGLYTCGPTVYNYAHIGNLRSYVFADILNRVLRYTYGEKSVRWVMNITDVDDKTIRDSRSEYPGMEPREALKKFTRKYEDLFWDDMKKLNILKPDAVPHAADQKYIAKMQDLIRAIVKAGYAYTKEGSVYFNVARFAEKHKYGRLVNIDMEGFRAGVRVDADEYEKDNVQDFVLWKGRKEGEPSWDFDLDGESIPGRPGWHIECSAMGDAELGTPFDIHTGGIDLKFPHHENEITQSVVGYGADKPVNYWLHNEFLLVDGVKMSKRFKNFYTLRDIEKKKIKPLAFRYLCMQTGYGKTMNFTFESLKAAESGLEHLVNQVRNLGTEKGKVINEYDRKFRDAINDDLNVTQALAVTQEMLKSNELKEDKLKTIFEFNKVLGLGLNKFYKDLDASMSLEVRGLKLEREKARADNNYEESDRLRSEIEKHGYTVEDLPGGMRVFKK